jgi:hypothetical protein
MDARKAAVHAGGAAALLWTNAYICRDWFWHPTAWMNSLHGYYAALARAGVSWSPAWWPFWDCGIPFEFTSAPLLPAMSAALAALRRTPPSMGYQAVSAIFYCAAPLALFALACAITRAPVYSFFAALFYSLLSPAQILAPDGAFSWAEFAGAHRFKLLGLWDETPHCAALTFLFLFLAVRERRVAAVAFLALAMLAWPFAIVAAGLSLLCLHTVRKTNTRHTAWIVVWALLLTARFLPPSLWYAMGAALAAQYPWNLGVVKGLAGAAVIWFTIEHVIERRAIDWRLRWMALWAFAMGCAPLILRWAHSQVLPQAYRFRLEMEAAVALLAVFGLRAALERAPRVAKGAIAAAALALAVPLTIHERRLAKDVLYPADVTHTIEYRAAQRIARELPGARVLLPGSIAHWANAFTDIPQFSGGEGDTAYSQTQQSALRKIFEGDDAHRAVALLQAYGTTAVAVSSPGSSEVWKPFEHPEKFDGVLPVLWSEEGVTVYRVPGDPAILEWKDRNHVAVHSVATPGQVISVPISYHPGWHAVVGGSSMDVHRDSLGLVSLRAAQPGPATVELTYDGGWELRLCGWITIAAALAAAWVAVRGGFR